MSAPRLDVAPWEVREPRVDPDTLGPAEAIFALSNGYVGIRGTLDEVDPCVERGTYLSGVFETHPLAYPEGGYGHPEEGQAIVAVPDGTQIRLVVDGVPLDVREARPEQHERALDLRAGTLDRVVRWRAPSGTTLELRSRRLVSLAERAVAAVRWELRAVEGPAHVVVRSELSVGTRPPEVESDDPRVAQALDDPFTVLDTHASAAGGSLALRTRRTGITVAASVEHDVDGATSVASETGKDRVVTTVVASLTAGDRLTLTKTLGYAWSRDAAADSVVERAVAAVRSGRDRGWAGLLEDQRQALRYDLFQLHGASAQVSQAPVGAKGLTGAGYNGHTFWDIEGFVLPVLTLLQPEAAARLLRWRASTLDAARHRAGVIDWEGAAFAWRTIDGHETSAYWPASTALRYLREAALVDLRDIQGDTSEGLHLASLGGAWLALVAGLGGLREDHDVLELAPLLPTGITRIRFHVTWRGALLRVETTAEGTTVQVLDGAGPVAVVVDGTELTVTGAPVTVPLREPAPLRPEPVQPVGKEPRT